ncbi:hypothetical protein [Foetidibacter luteolus]|uniref:hypothetical protein n=1 Tax=Foetidibacter luteolus TaxID=2608880 RepID=UPI00129A144F|nr:hypothetical protein [Foetidibacter luteolus]
MKPLTIVALIVFAIASVLYAIVWFIAVPATAKTLLPYKWRSIALQQKRDDYRLFIGEPADKDSSFTIKKDKWVAKRGNFEFNLEISYNNDTVANSYTLTYHFKNFFFSKTEALARR